VSTMVAELYDALRKAGVDEQTARDAARAVLGAEARADLVTRADLAAGLAELKADVIKWNVGAMAVLTAIFAALVRLG
jgi:aromatic ring hydroxylase